MLVVNVIDHHHRRAHAGGETLLFSLEVDAPVRGALPGLDAEFAVIKLDLAGIECSFATACRTYKDESSSYVIEALGKRDCALSSLRLTLGRGTTEAETDQIIKLLDKTVKDLRQ